MEIFAPTMFAHLEAVPIPTTQLPVVTDCIAMVPTLVVVEAARHIQETPAEVPTPTATK